MALVLLSGRPGAGKTEYGNWLAERHGFVHLETDDREVWAAWGPLLCADGDASAVEVVRRARALGKNVIVEWGFPVHLLGRVRQLRDAGFDAWWFDGDEPAARAGYMRRRGAGPDDMQRYRVQVNGIHATASEIRAFYGNHSIDVVTSGPNYMSYADVYSSMFGSGRTERGSET